MIRILGQKQPPLINTPNEEGQTPLHLACNEGHLEAAKALLELKADVNSKNRKRYGVTPLHLAAHSGSSDLVLLLLQRGADIDATKTNSQYPNTPIQCAR